MMRVYFRLFVNDDSSVPTCLRCQCCKDLFLDKIGPHAIAACFNSWVCVARQDRLANIFLKWLAFPAGLTVQGKYVRDEVEGLLVSTKYWPAVAPVFPPPTAPGKAPKLPTVICFSVKRPFNTTNREDRRDFRTSAISSQAIISALRRKGTGLLNQGPQSMEKRLSRYSMAWFHARRPAVSRWPFRIHRIPVPERCFLHFRRLLRTHFGSHQVIS